MFSKTIIVGHLGRDPELRYTSGGQSVCSFSVATSRSWTDQNGQPQEKTTWFRVTAWGKLGELCNQYLSKGRLVLVEGEVDASAWSAQTGEPRASLELTARNVRFLGGRDGAGAPTSGRMGGEMGAPHLDEEEIPF
jgi:single-strand DNA-binding protein